MSMEAINEARRISQRLKPSRRWEKLKLDQKQHLPWREGGFVEVEFWYNRIYSVTVRRFGNGWPLNDGPWAQIGIHCEDGEARHDWRDFQRIKNDTVGADWEALELYPAEARLLDPSNYYLLFAAPSLPFGNRDKRTICSPENCIAPQRGWAKGDQPA